MLPLISFLMVAYSYFLIRTNLPHLPTRIPTHFNARRYGGRLGKSGDALGFVGRTDSDLRDHSSLFRTSANGIRAWCIWDRAA